ncbi:siphovirus Gp157 family protein [Denitrobaculum tricleocarpae]|uniref:Siphovirus Gp157 family protein n=1 Tax=Denitrobaculum tricleocarpae TaxID=2591009 RepID=A0A545TT14_9PROT|nr:siphovirus Gp157 family protein [Denitrobaculum tricleocarpae]TQV80360.1 hypothetical protein FKG95_09195 [Denitrobaculum tricleocarpae]
MTKDTAVVQSEEYRAKPGSEVVALKRELKDRLELADQLQDYNFDPVALADTLDGEGNFDEACEAVVRQAQLFRSYADGLDNYIKSLQSRKDRLKKSSETLKNVVLAAMEKASKKSIQGVSCTITAKPTPRSVVIEDEAEIPVKYWVTKDPVIDKRAIAADLKEKVAIPGATLSNGGITLQVRNL